MVQQASAVDPVYQCGSSDGGFISSNVRPVEDMMRLRWTTFSGSVCGKLEVVRFRGPIFFGVAPTLEDDVEKLIRVRPDMSHIILDMTRVTQVDNSGARALAAILRSASAAGVRRIAVSGAADEVETELLCEGVVEDRRKPGADGALQAAELFQTLDDALEAYEEEILAETIVTPHEGEPYPESAHVLTEEQWELVRNTGRAFHLLDGELLCTFDDPVDGVWVLVGGRVKVETMSAGTEMEGRVIRTTAKYRAPFTIGSAAWLMRAKSHAFRMSALGPKGAHMLLLTEANLRQLEKDRPDVYAMFVRNCVGHSCSVEAFHLRWRSALNE